MPGRAKVTDDALFGGAVALVQPARGFGYRANVDALLLAAFALRSRPARLAVDLGAGVGTVALALDHLGGARSLLLIERQPHLVELACANVARNGLASRARVEQLDLAEGLDAKLPDVVRSADLVVANPPYVTLARDRAGIPQGSRWEARHGELSPFLRAAADALAHRGRACFVYPAHALLDLMALSRRLGLEPKRLRMVHSAADRPARVALVELARAKPGGLVIEPPLLERIDGQQSPELLALLQAPRATALAR